MAAFLPRHPRNWLRSGGWGGRRALSQRGLRDSEQCPPWASVSPLYMGVRLEYLFLVLGEGRSCEGKHRPL